MPNQARVNDPIANQIEQAGVSPDATYLDLMGLPSNVLAWLFTRPLKQVEAAARIAKYAGQAMTGTLLKHDENVLVLTTQSGVKLNLYPDGGIGSNGIPVDPTPEGIQAVLGGSMASSPMAGSVPVLRPEMSNFAVVSDMETPMDNSVGIEVDMDNDPEVTPIDNGGIIEEPMIGVEAGESDIDQWIDSLEMELKPEERSQAAELSMNILDSVGNATSPFRTERKKKRSNR